MEGEPPRLSKRDEEKARDFGGADKDDYTSQDTVNYCDKGGHLIRSIENDPNHQEHWKKERNNQ